MPFQAQVVQVLIASPSDTASERAAVQGAIHQWNADNAEDKSTVLLPLMSEFSTYPAVGRPQGQVNKQMVERADIVVAFFSTRLGTATSEAVSGTVEEIMNRVNAAKQALVYFNAGQVKVSSLDTEQLQALQDFKRTWLAGNYGYEYKNSPDLRGKIRSHLTRVINDLFSGSRPVDEGTTAAMNDQMRRIAREEQESILSKMVWA